MPSPSPEKQACIRHDDKFEARRQRHTKEIYGATCKQWQFDEDDP